MNQLVLALIILEVVGKPHPYWTPDRYEKHEPELLKIKKKRGKAKKCAQQKDWFRHSDDDMSRWLEGLKKILFVNSMIVIQVNGWCFATLLEDPGFCWHLLNCLEEFYKHHMHISIIECINIMVDAFLAYESGCDEYDRNSQDESVWQHRTLCCDNLNIPFAALCMFMNDPVQYQFISDDLGKILIRRIRSFYRKTDRPDVFSSLSFDSLGIPTYHESSGISLVDLLRPSGRIAYPIESVFSINPQYKKFGEVFRSLIHSKLFMDPVRFFKRAFGYLGDSNPVQNLTVLRTILRNQCKDVAFTQSEISLVIMQFLRAFPNSTTGVSFMGFQLHTFLRSYEKSLRLRSQLCRPLPSPLPMGCDQLPFDAPAVKRIKMIGFLMVMFSKLDWTSDQQSYSIISIVKRVLGGLLL
jgi:hypothetical protein